MNLLTIVLLAQYINSIETSFKINQMLLKYKIIVVNAHQIKLFNVEDV